MQRELLPEDVLKSLGKGQVAPFLLLYGPDEFRMERLLRRIRDTFLSESERDLNLEIFYGDEADPGEIMLHARSMPFLARSRLLIVQRAEAFTEEELESFLPYLADPSDTSVLIFVCSKPDFRKAFYAKFRSAGRAVSFEALKERQVLPWIKRTAEELGFTIDERACDYLYFLVGNSLRHLYSELEKLHLRFGKNVGLEEVKELAADSRIFTIYELVRVVTEKKCPEALAMLDKYLEEEDQKKAPLGLMGMLNREIRLLWITKVRLGGGEGASGVAGHLGLPPFAVEKLARNMGRWSVEDLEQALSLLYKADGLIKSGSRPRPVLENLVMTLCGGRALG